MGTGLRAQRAAGRLRANRRRLHAQRRVPHHHHPHRHPARQPSPAWPHDWHLATCSGVPHPHRDPRGHRVTKPIATGMGHDSWVPRVIRRDGNQSLYLIPRQVLHAARLPSLSLAQHSLTGSLKNHRFWLLKTKALPRSYETTDQLQLIMPIMISVIVAKCGTESDARPLDYPPPPPPNPPLGRSQHSLQ